VCGGGGGVCVCVGGGGGDDGNASWKGWVIAISRCGLHDMPVVAAPNGFQGDALL
jgi:hypothetical protein